MAEGAKLLDTAFDAGAPVESLYAAPEAAANANAARVVERALAAGVRVHRLERGVMERVGDTVTPQPVCGVVAYLDVALADLVSAERLLLVCVGVRDPGNLGAVIRVADALGCGGVACCGSTVDTYNPKVVRASAGSIFNVPFSVAGPDSGAALAALTDAGFRLLSTAARGGSPYDGVDLRGRVAILLGNEGAGLPAEVAGSADAVLTIPIEGRAESLNVAMTAAVLAAEAAHQRRRHP